MSSTSDLPSTIRIISLNCWGLKYISTYRHARLVEIGHQLATASPVPQIVGLQECWTQEDYLAIREITKDILPYGKFFWSGCFGGGLAILSKWKFEETGLWKFSLNGRPQAFWRGDWFVGKGVGCARIRMPGGGGGEEEGKGKGLVVEVFVTHLHAPYEKEPNDSYLCHRTAQAWEIAKLMRHARERGHMVIGLGDFNMVPGSLAHRIIEGYGGGVRDVWKLLYPDSMEGSAESEAEQQKGRKLPTAQECLDLHGATCDSKFNTWRWSEEMRKALHKGKEVRETDPEEEDVKAKRLDYIFFADAADTITTTTGQAWKWEPTDLQVGMRMRHPTLKCSLSDHFSIETTLSSTNPPSAPTSAAATAKIHHLPLQTYTHIQSLTTSYIARERHQRKWRITHFFVSFSISIACSIAIWWSPRNFVAFLLLLLSTLGLSAGVMDGLIGLLFVGSELRALKEFEYEVENAAAQTHMPAQKGYEDRGVVTLSHLVHREHAGQRGGK
ncbi:hypothetical protein CERZMDRAFT_112792 [Cercospora zeae-maydis SCOH1-5]|uniref:Endonuclease/exonuclease/phosphatase domain-containing protein n=1 Tax=Cercospora zeae-maydis SCOH1-5 TaxID=717836 RepID=A0A6A6FDG2_9PEZI|nr:hypothetical protein CERZMDRAFT_112792 [Cercospora zeae-maydis SCOH1-5]